MFGSDPKECTLCKQKDGFIADLITQSKRPCTPCANHLHEIEYLRSQIDTLREEWRNERSEFKRTVDRLMELAGSRPVGQGPTQEAPEMQSVEQMMGVFDEVTTE